MKVRDIRNLFFFHWFMEKLKINMYWALNNLWITKKKYCTFVKVVICHEDLTSFYSKRRQYPYIWVKLRVRVLRQSTNHIRNKFRYTICCLTTRLVVIRIPLIALADFS
jgi:hypothetical protein